MADRIGVSFTIPTDSDPEISALGIPSYADTVWFDTLEEFQATTVKELDALKTGRYQAWRTIILTPQPVEEAPAVSSADVLQQAQQALADAQASIQSVIDASE